MFQAGGKSLREGHPGQKGTWSRKVNKVNEPSSLYIDVLNHFNTLSNPSLSVPFPSPTSLVVSSNDPYLSPTIDSTIFAIALRHPAFPAVCSTMREEVMRPCLEEIEQVWRGICQRG